ncbi:MAG: type II toxin-antitoxin system RelE/ParE family toxin [Paludibacteraceae bacterium]|jgi:plasmid stabilization system protein ParE|nr:type II toxin-antitoxin system RelE/ParE family toxin [Paludibacteraceae bacterium]
MKIVRTPRALAGIREVATYIAKTFGQKALLDFKQRLSECTKAIKDHPGSGTIDWDVSNADKRYLSMLVYRKSWMVYRVEGDIIYIVDFYDTRKAVPSHRQYE